MKYIKFKYLIVLGLFLGLHTACEENQDVVTENATEGAFLSIDGSSASLAGSINPELELEESPVDFTEAALDYTATVSAGAAQVAELVIVKTFRGQEVEVARGTPAEGVSANYTTIDEFLSGFTGVTADDLRVGDVITFQTQIHMTDGRVLVNPSAALAVQVSCAADLTGTYTVTNSACGGSFVVEITRNADGSYYLTSADGGFLHRCTANSTLINWGTIVEQCGQILPTGNVRFAELSGNNIGNIVGGTWDAETGTLTMQHTQSFTANWPGEWTSTYVRQ